MSALRWAFRLGRSGRSRLALAVLLGSLASGAAVGLSATAAWLIARASQQPPVLHLMVAIVAVRFFGVARGALRYSERLAGHEASFRVLGDLRVATIRQLERVLPGRRLGAGGSPATGDLLSRFVGDVDALGDIWVRVVLPYAAALVVGGGSVVLVAALVPAAGLVLALTLLAAAVAAPALSIRAARGAAARLAPLRGTYEAEVLDLLDGATELAVYGALPARLGHLDDLDQAMVRADARSARGAGSGAALAAVAAGAATATGLWLGAGAVDAQALAPTSLAVVTLVPLAVHEIFAALAPAAHRIPALAQAARRVREVFDQPDAVVEPPVALPVPLGGYGLRIRGLCARWSPDAPDVLRGVDLDLEAGSRTILVGPSGSGKSTLAAVLLRLLDPSAGSVELVGRDRAVALTQLSGDSVRRIVGWCAQDAYIFDSTIEANLRLARPDATADELDDALRRARLSPWIDELPRGLDTMVGEHGNRLSGGQRQRLALARVLLADRPVVVFDEPTEHLDEPTAAALAIDLCESTRGRTLLIVTHRPELFPPADAVVALHDGALVTTAGYSLSRS